MTMVVIACRDDRAIVMTDSMAYTEMVKRVGSSSKVMPLPHISTLIVSQGDADFGITAKAWLEQSSEDHDFDGLVEEAPRLLAEVWERMRPHLGPESEGTIFLVGYSASEGRFKACGFAADDGFRRFDIDGMFVMPTPWHLRPSPLEEGRICRPDAPQHAQEVFAQWVTCEPPTIPATVENWVSLAFVIRESRALQPFGRVLVGGSAYLTILTKDEVSTTKMFDFDDEGEMEQLVAGTWHPRALPAPCPCGSEKPFEECHLLQQLAEPCVCGSGAAAGDCCAPKPA